MTLHYRPEEERYFAAVAAKNQVRTAVRAIIRHGDRVLVQRGSADYYAFIGGEYELGDTIEDRIRKEVAEETNATLTECRFLFVVENRFVAAGHRLHTLELYVEATVDRVDVHSREAHLKQEWLPLDTLASVDLRPHAVRDVLADGTYETVRHLVVDGWPGNAFRT